MYDISFYTTSTIGFIILIILAMIDLRTYLLPNLWVGLFALMGFLHHFLNGFSYLSLEQSILGLVTGMAFLLIVRFFANRHYKRDTLGMGDVKLMGAGGLWLGFPHILVSLSIGAFAAAIIGIILTLWYNNKNPEQKTPLLQSNIPAGPGFIVGIILTFLWIHT